jgi:hypothetical protein
MRAHTAMRRNGQNAIVHLAARRQVIAYGQWAPGGASQAANPKAGAPGVNWFAANNVLRELRSYQKRNRAVNVGWPSAVE